MPPSSPPALVIAIDGPAGAGKSSVARAVAERLGFFLLDTGAIYRAVAWQALEAGISLDDGEALGEVAGSLDIRFLPGRRVAVGERDVTESIRSPEVSLAASQVSAHPSVRKGLLEIQRSLAKLGRCVVEGRDIGTVVLPWAPCKFFMTASAEVRAKRRFDELRAKGLEVDFESTLSEIVLRDRRDETRAVAPLIPAEDALRIDTSDLTPEAVVDKLVTLAQKKLKL